jgi:Protein of unknown function (DUF4244)
MLTEGVGLPMLKASNRRRSEAGMTTAEYAFGIIAAVGLACLLFLLVDFVQAMIEHIIGAGLSHLTAFMPFGGLP